MAWRVNNNDRIDLKADKQAYKVGETVKLLVPSPFSGTVNALVTVERGRFLSSQVVQLKSNSDILDIPVEAAYAPNAFVSVLIVKGVDESNNIPAFKLGYVGIQVDPGEFKLNVEIEPDKTVYAPRDTVTYDIRVTDAAGNPVQAELSLALVDKAVLSLADPNSPPIVDAFYGVRGLGIRTADSLSVNVDRVTAKIAAEYGKGGGGGGLASAMEGLFVRQNFKDTAYWEGVVDTDAQGNARVQVTLPDNLTTWVMDARAVTADTKVGQAANEILSTKSLLIRPVTPRFFVVGDSAVLGAVVNNNTDGDIEAEVSLAARGVSAGRRRDSEGDGESQGQRAGGLAGHGRRCPERRADLHGQGRRAGGQQQARTGDRAEPGHSHPALCGAGDGGHGGRRERTGPEAGGRRAAAAARHGQERA